MNCNGNCTRLTYQNVYDAYTSVQVHEKVAHIANVVTRGFCYASDQAHAKKRNEFAKSLETRNLQDSYWPVRDKKAES